MGQGHGGLEPGGFRHGTAAFVAGDRLGVEFAAVVFGRLRPAAVGQGHGGLEPGGFGHGTAAFVAGDRFGVEFAAVVFGRLGSAPVGQGHGGLKPGGFRHGTAALVGRLLHGQAGDAEAALAAAGALVAEGVGVDEAGGGGTGCATGVALGGDRHQLAAVAGFPTGDLPVPVQLRRDGDAYRRRLLLPASVVGEVDGQAQVFAVALAPLLGHLVGGHGGAVAHILPVAPAADAGLDPAAQDGEQGQGDGQDQGDDADGGADGVLFIWICVDGLGGAGTQRQGAGQGQAPGHP